MLDSRTSPPAGKHAAPVKAKRRWNLKEWNVLGGLAGFAITSIVLLVTFARDPGGAATQSFNAVVTMFLGHTVFNGLLAAVSVSLVAVVMLLEPVIATALAWWLFSELPGPSFWAGAPMVLAGVWLATTGSRRM